MTLLSAATLQQITTVKTGFLAFITKAQSEDTKTFHPHEFGNRPFHPELEKGRRRFHHRNIPILG